MRWSEPTYRLFLDHKSFDFFFLIKQKQNNGEGCDLDGPAESFVALWGSRWTKVGF